MTLLEKSEKKGLGRAIRVIRTELGLSRRELEERTRLSYTYLSEIEAGKKTPSPVALQAISIALEVPEEELLDRARSIEVGRGAWSSPSDRARQARHFHEVESQSTDPLVMASMRSPSEERTRTPDPAEELLYLARALPPEDVQSLIALARRLLR